MTAGSNHIKGSPATHMAASTNNLASTNRMHALQYFGTGAVHTPGAVAAGAIIAVEPHSECTQSRLYSILFRARTMKVTRI